MRIKVPVAHLPIDDQLPINFTTLRVDIDLIHEWNAIATRIDLTNRDTATLQYSINNRPLVTLAGSSALLLENIPIEHVTIIPNTASGLGDISLNITYISDHKELFDFGGLGDINIHLQGFDKQIKKKWYMI